MRGQIKDEEESDAGDRRKRNPRDAGGDRGIVDRKTDERDEKSQPPRRDVRGPYMPAAEVEISEQEDKQGCGKYRLGARPPDAIGLTLDAEKLVPEAEVDADIGKDRPGKRRSGGKDHRPFDHEHDRQKQRQQTGNADDDAFVERQARQLIFVRVRLPQHDLREVRRAKLADISDRRSGIERQTEDIGVGTIDAFGRRSLACRNRRQSRRAEIRPDHTGADKTEMRHHDQPLDLLLGIVRQRENDPARARAGLQCAHFDAAYDAVGTGRGRDLQAVALRGIALDGLRQINCRGIERHPHRLDRCSRRQTREHKNSGEEIKKRTQHGVL